MPYARGEMSTIPISARFSIPWRHLPWPHSKIGAVTPILNQLLTTDHFSQPPNFAPFTFSTAFHRKICKSCDEQPLLRIQKVQTGNMHHRPSRTELSAPTVRTLAASPLFRNILRASPCSSRFCPGRPRSEARNLMKRRILGVSAEKKLWTYPEPVAPKAKGQTP
jgi:hypothetical protein